MTTMSTKEHDKLQILVRKELEADFDNVYDTAEAEELFRFIQFCAPYVLVERKSDGKEGLLQFSHLPRFYFGFGEV